MKQVLGYIIKHFYSVEYNFFTIICLVFFFSFLYLSLLRYPELHKLKQKKLKESKKEKLLSRGLYLVGVQWAR